MPEAPRVNVVDIYHGVKVADPFRYMEDPEAPETKAYVDAQNEITHEYLNNIPVRELIRQRLTGLWNYAKVGVPQKVADKYVISRNDGLQNQSVYYLHDSLDGEGRVLLDPNKLSDDGTVALTNMSFTKDGKLMAYATSESGSDWQQIRIMDVEQGGDLPDVIKWCKFTSIPWLPDGSGFFYTRFPEPGTVPKEDAVNFSKIYLHKLGTDQSEDQLIYERPDFKQLGFSSRITEDGTYLLLHVSLGTNPENRVYYRELNSQGEFIRLLDENDAMYRFIGNDGSLFYFHTTYQAPNGRVIAIDVDNPGRENWQELIAESQDVLQGVTMVNNQFVAMYLHNAFGQVKLFQRDGSPAGEIELPTLGSLAGMSGKREHKEMFLGFTSYLYPTTVFRYDFESGKLVKYWAPDVDFNPDEYETKQVFYPSKDGTKVPMFITHKKGVKLDGSNPTVLYGYGGFNASSTPNFSVSNLVWLEAGGVYAVACLRGGSEYGQTWHRAGMLEQKQNVFDDFIAAAEWLIENKYTKVEKLAIMGRSNGGLLVAACMTQRPDLFGAVVCWVPVIDMLRYHRFTAGRYWTGEYGDAEKYPDHFRFMLAYSPLHNVKFGTVYPPVIVMTAESDDRVVPMHSKKFAATLQAAAGGDNPIYLRVESKAGHGAGKPTSKLIDEQADIYAFLWDQLKIEG